MSIKQRLVGAFVAVAGVPVNFIAAWITFDQCQQAKHVFIESSGRETRQIDIAMQLFFKGISQNASYLENLAAVHTAESRLMLYLRAGPELPNENALA